MKNIFAKITSFILVIVMLLGLTACGGNSGGGGENLPTDEEGNVIVKIMFHVDKSSTEGQAYQKRVNAFNAAYKDKGIKAQAIFKARSAGASGYETELLNNQLEGTLADIITFDAPNTAAYAKSGLLYDISDLISADLEPCAERGNLLFVCERVELAVQQDAFVAVGYVHCRQ